MPESLAEGCQAVGAARARGRLQLPAAQVREPSRFEAQLGLGLRRLLQLGRPALCRQLVLPLLSQKALSRVVGGVLGGRGVPSRRWRRSRPPGASVECWWGRVAAGGLHQFSGVSPAALQKVVGRVGGNPKHRRRVLDELLGGQVKAPEVRRSPVRKSGKLSKRVREPVGAPVCAAYRPAVGASVPGGCCD